MEGSRIQQSHCAKLGCIRVYWRKVVREFFTIGIFLVPHAHYKNIFYWNKTFFLAHTTISIYIYLQLQNKNCFRIAYYFLNKFINVLLQKNNLERLFFFNEKCEQNLTYNTSADFQKEKTRKQTYPPKFIVCELSWSSTTSPGPLFP